MVAEIIVDLRASNRYRKNEKIFCSPLMTCNDLSVIFLRQFRRGCSRGITFKSDVTFRYDETDHNRRVYRLGRFIVSIIELTWNIPYRTCIRGRNVISECNFGAITVSELP